VIYAFLTLHYSVGVYIVWRWFHGTVAERGTNDHLTVPINSAELAHALRLNLADCADHAAELSRGCRVHSRHGNS